MKLSEKKYTQRVTLGQSGNTVMMLIAICLIMFVMLAFMKAVWYFRYPKELAPVLFDKNVMSWFVMPAAPSEILYRPWTIITHMFVHDNFWKVFTNMLWLWCFGYILQELTGNKKVIPIFIYGALGGALAFSLAFNIIPSLQPLLPFARISGAAAGVMAIAVAVTVLSPGYRIFPMLGGGLPLWALTAFYIIIDIATVSGDSGNLVAHIAGGITGGLFVFFLQRGTDGSKWMNGLFDWISNLFNPDKPKKGRDIRDELFYKADKTPYKKIPTVTQQRIDSILDKINQHGYDYLTEEEKDLLARASQEEL